VRSLTRLLVVCLLGAAAALPATASAADPGKKPLRFAVDKIGPNGDISCTIEADLYTPVGASKDDPVPAMLATNGFGGSKNDFGTLGMSYARRGYAFLAYSGLGFGGSDCKITLDDPDYDGKAGSQLVDFLAGTKAAEDGTKIDFIAKEAPGDPVVGMIGGSYGGQIQFAIAGIDPRIDALNPQITWNDLSYSLGPNNTDFVKGVTYGTPGVIKSDWPVLFTALGFADPVKSGDADASHLGPCPNFNDQVCPSLATSATLGYPQPDTLAFLRHASVATYMDRIRIPTFLSQGLSDSLFDEQEAVATYQALRAQGTPVKMLWRSNGHSGGGLGGQESDSANLEKAYESRLELEWFDFYLKGIGDPPKLDFSFLRDWALPESGDAAPAVGQTPTYPAGTDRTFFLSSDGALVTSADKIQAGSAMFAAISGSATGSGNGFQNPPVPEDPASSTTFTSDPLPADFDFVGIPRFTVSLDAPVHAQTQGGDPGAKLVLFAKLVDVDGSDVTLPRGLSSAVRVADVTKPVTIELPGTAYRFGKGHQMRLVISTSNATNHGNNVSGPVSIKLDPKSPSPLTVPQLGQQVGAPGSGPSGTTSFEAAEGAPPPEQAVRPAFAAGNNGAARLPSSRRCASRRHFIIHLKKAPRGDRIKKVTVTINGKRQKVIRGKRIRARVDLRGLPKGTIRVLITVRTKKGRTLRSARTYHTCGGVKRP
jgi:ABC-2 type transport system ATP-binding protein